MKKKDRYHPRPDMKRYRGGYKPECAEDYMPPKLPRTGSYFKERLKDGKSRRR